MSDSVIFILLLSRRHEDGPRNHRWQFDRLDDDDAVIVSCNLRAIKYTMDIIVYAIDLVKAFDSIVYN